MSSSGKSSVASVNIRSSTSASTSARTSRENAPVRLRAAARAAVAVAGIDQVGHAFGLRQVELAVEERALRELPGLREPRPELDAAREQQAQHRRSAVAVQLQHVLAGVGARRREVQREALVERLAARAAEGRRRRGRAAAGCRARCRGDHRAGPLPRTRARRRSRRARRGGDRDDRVGSRGACRGTGAARHRSARVSAWDGPAALRPRLAPARALPRSALGRGGAPLPSRAPGSCATAGRSGSGC